MLSYDVDAAGAEGKRSTGIHMGGVQHLQNPHEVMTIHLRVESELVNTSLKRPIFCQV